MNIHNKKYPVIWMALDMKSKLQCVVSEFEDGLWQEKGSTWRGESVNRNSYFRQPFQVFLIKLKAELL